MLAAGATCHSVTHCLCHLYVGCRSDLSFCHTQSLSLIIYWLQERHVILSHTVSVTYMLAAGAICHSANTVSVTYVLAAGETFHFVTHCLCHLSHIGCRSDLSFCHTLSLSLICWLQERPVILSHTVSVTYHTLAAGATCHSVTHCLCHLSYIGCKSDLSFCHTLSLSLFIYWLQERPVILSLIFWLHERPVILSHTVSVTYMLAAGETCHFVTHCLCHLYVGCRRDLSFCHTLYLSLICWLLERSVILSHIASVTYMLAAGETFHFFVHCLCHLCVGCRRDLSFCHKLSLSLIRWLQE